MKMLTKAVLAAVLATASIGAFASDKSGWFVGADFSQASDMKADGVKVGTQWTDVTVGNRWSVSDNTAIGFELGGGNTHYNVAVEGYGNGTSNETHSFVGVNGRTNFGATPLFVTYRAGGYNESFDAGYNTYYSTETAFYGGVGVGYDFTDHFSGHVSYLYLAGPNGAPHRDTAQIGLEWRF